MQGSTGARRKSFLTLRAVLVVALMSPSTVREPEVFVVKVRHSAGGSCGPAGRHVSVQGMGWWPFISMLGSVGRTEGLWCAPSQALRQTNLSRRILCQPLVKLLDHCLYSGVARPREPVGL